MGSGVFRRRLRWLKHACRIARERRGWGVWGWWLWRWCFCSELAQTTAIGYKQDHFLASKAQFIGAAVAIALLVVTAFLIPVRREDAPGGTAPSAWIVGARCAVVWVGGAVCTEGLGMGSSGGAACAGCGDVGAGDCVVGRFGLGTETSTRAWSGCGAGVWMACVFAASGGGEAGCQRAGGECDVSGGCDCADLVCGEKERWWRR